MIRWQNYNEFRGWVRWHDYFSFMVNEFAILLVRRYDWFDHNPPTSTFIVTVCGVNVFHKCY
jgi:SRSO17 transposase